MSKENFLFERRKRRNRYNLKQRSGGLPRLSVFRSGRHIYAQIIDDVKGVTVASAASSDKDLSVKSGGGVEAAEKVGGLIATRAKKAGIEQVVFDRGGYVYHGRVKALADAARSGGLNF